MTILYWYCNTLYLFKLEQVPAIPDPEKVFPLHVRLVYHLCPVVHSLDSEIIRKGQTPYIMNMYNVLNLKLFETLENVNGFTNTVNSKLHSNKLVKKLLKITKTLTIMDYY